MPIHKASILNFEISVNYQKDEKQQLLKAINLINSKLESYDNLNGKISDSKLLCFLAIKLQAEILDLNHKNINKSNLEKKFTELNHENINLNDKLYQLHEKNKLLINDNQSLEQDFNQILLQLDKIINLLKKAYEE